MNPADHDYLTAGENPYARDTARDGCSLCGEPYTAHRNYNARRDRQWQGPTREGERR